MESCDVVVARQKKKRKFYKTLVNMIGVLFCFVFVNGLLAYMSSTLSDADPQMKYLFSSNKPVYDIYNGSMESLEILLRRQPITIVMYYAPWSGQTQKHAVVIRQLATILLKRNTKIGMIAINCWVGTCRQVFQTPYFPRIFFYHTTYLPIEYLQNVDLSTMMAFLRSAIRPLIYIGNEAQLNRFLDIYDNNVIAFMEDRFIKEDSKRFNTYFQTTLELINTVNKPQFGVVTNKTLALKIGLYYHGQIVSKVYNKNLQYYSDSEYTPSKIRDWLLRNSRMLVKVLSPSHSNVKEYLSDMEKGPVIILFISPQLTRYYSQIYSLFHRTALLYYKCQCPVVKPTLINNYRNMCVTLLKHSNTICTLCQHTDSTIKTFNKEFLNFLKMKDQVVLNVPVYCVCYSYSSCYSKIVYTKCCFRFLPQLESIIRRTINDGNIRNVHKQNDLIEAASEKSIRNIYKIVNMTMEFMKDDESDRKTVAGLKNALREKLKEVLYKQQEVHLKPAHESYTKENQKVIEKNKCGKTAPCCTTNQFDTAYTFNQFEGLACRTNKTLSFYEMDSMKYRYALDSFGVESQNTLLIVDPYKEEYFNFMNANVTYESIVEFIRNFTFGVLRQTFPSSLHTRHSAGRSFHYSSGDNDEVVIKELTSNNFLKVVMDPEKNVFVLFYTTWCGVCKIVNHQYIQLIAQYKTQNNILFTRINGGVHNLPYHLKPNSYPAFLFFPAHNKHLSVAFPKNLEYTLSNFVKFLDSYIK